MSDHKIHVIDLTEEKPLFHPGNIVATPAVMEAVTAAFAGECMAQHIMGNWGTVCEEDWAANDQSVKDGSRLLSAYTEPTNGTKFWLITEADRSVTTYLLPSEY